MSTFEASDTGDLEAERQGSRIASAARQPVEPAKLGAPVDQSDEVTVEEGLGAYVPGRFHPVYIGDISTKDIEGAGNHVYYALKVLSADCYGTDKDTFEREILRHLRDANKKHLGHKYICHLVDDFEHQGPNRMHVCLVLKLMGETLRTCGPIFEKTMVPNSLMRRFTFYLLAGLDYAHVNNVIHTDVEPNNIFVKIRDSSLIEFQYLKQVPSPVQDKLAGKYSLFPSQPLRRFYFQSGEPTLNFELAIGDWGVSSWADNHLTELIQPVLLRAPEVLIKAPWDATTDWWNLGAVILEVFRCVLMFDRRSKPHGRYEVKKHLEEMVAYFGPFPRGLLQRGDAGLVATYFDESGYALDPLGADLPSLEPDDYLDDLDEDARKNFLSFLYALMKLDPQERLPTMDLSRHPCLVIEGL